MNLMLDTRLFGNWKRCEPADEIVTLEFLPDGSLTYTVDLPEKRQVILLTYKTMNNKYMITDQPSRPKEEKTNYRLSWDKKKLTLDFQGMKEVYIKTK